MKNNDLQVSVIMSVYNSEVFLREAIDSILNQTYSEFEFVIVNDCSEDSSLRIIESYNDKRISVINNEKNLGLAASLNKAIKASHGKYIIRMDSDDYSIKNRIELLVTYMENRPTIGVSGSYFTLFGRVSPIAKLITRRPNIASRRNAAQLLFAPCVLHPSAIIRRKVLFDNNIFYNKKYIRAQDYELWTRLIRVCEITNMPKVLFKWRISTDQSSIKDRKRQIEYSKMIQGSYISTLLNRNPTDEELIVHSWINSRKKLSKIELFKLEAWLKYLVCSSISSNDFDWKEVKKECSIHWMNACFDNVDRRKRISTFLKSKLASRSSFCEKHPVLLIWQLFRK